ncbi:hypothetical protein [Caldiplasma sukawensis]
MGKIESFISHFIIRAKWNRRNRIIFSIVASAAIICFLAILLNEELSYVISVKIYSILLIGSMFIMLYSLFGVKWIDKPNQ